MGSDDVDDIFEDFENKTGSKKETRAHEKEPSEEDHLKKKYNQG